MSEKSEALRMADQLDRGWAYKDECSEIAAELRISAQASSRCNDCGDCYAVCPEPQVIPVALKGKDGAGPVIRSADCTNCGRCIDVCSTDVFRFTHRWDSRRV